MKHVPASVDGGIVLTADLVRVQRRQGRLHIIKLEGVKAKRAETLAAALLEVLSRNRGNAREILLGQWKAIDHKASEKRLLLGLQKLLLDGCEFETLEGAEPAQIRAEVFTRANHNRRELEEGVRFDRRQILAEVGRELGLDAEEVERRLYADLRGAQRLTRCALPSPNQLVDDYRRSSAQAVLLKAIAVEVDLVPHHPAAARRLFHRLKFLRLLYELRSTETGYRLSIDGPLSLFRSVTKYGLQLAQLLPALERCGPFELKASLLWGKAKEPLSFSLSHSESLASESSIEMAPEIAKLMTQFAQRESEWSLASSQALLDLPGLGTCIPDLLATHRPTGEQIHVELLGFWSRAAVWRRVEWVQRGMREKILFCCSQRLRVSEAILDDDLPSALYVFKGVLSPSQIEKRLDILRLR